MNPFRLKDLPRSAAIAALVLAVLPITSQAQNFEYLSTSTGKGALLAGFRRPGLDNFELVVKLGNITDYLALPPGSTMDITEFTPAQLSAAFSAFTDLEWSVTATHADFGAWEGFPGNTIWYTVPRLNLDQQTTPPARYGSSGQGNVRTRITSIGAGARSISLQIGTIDDNNNSVLVREPLPSDWAYSSFIVNPQTGTANFRGYLPVNAEQTTPSDEFSSPVRSDFYQSVPNHLLDPVTGETTGLPYHVGYFTLNPDGTMAFTRAALAQPEAPQITSITRVGDTSTVSFTTVAGGLTYRLHYTSTAGITAPIADWAVSPTTVEGDGSIQQLTDTTADEDRIYAVSQSP